MYFIKIFKNFRTKHHWHLLDPSPWLLVASVAAFSVNTKGVLYMHNYLLDSSVFNFGFCLLIFVMYVWWRDVVREATLEELHNFAVQRGLRLGMVLFIISEIMFFLTFLWAFFHSSLALYSFTVNTELIITLVLYFFIFIFINHKFFLEFLDHQLDCNFCIISEHNVLIGGAIDSPVWCAIRLPYLNNTGGQENSGLSPKELIKLESLRIKFQRLETDQERSDFLVETLSRLDTDIILAVGRKVQHERKLMECIAEINSNPGNIKLLKKKEVTEKLLNQLIQDESELRNVREATDAAFRSVVSTENLPNETMGTSPFYKEILDCKLFEKLTKFFMDYF